MPRSLAGPAVIALLLAGCASASRPSASRILEVSPLHRGPHNAIVRVVTDRRLVALTFDDGPSARYTPTILRLLRAAGAHATFFMVGETALREPGIVRATVRAGHEIGDHTFDHARLPDLSPARIAWELGAGARALEQRGAPTPRYSRPPWGDFDERVAAISAALGYSLIGSPTTTSSTASRRAGTCAGAIAPVRSRTRRRRLPVTGSSTSGTITAS